MCLHIDTNISRDINCILVWRIVRMVKSSLGLRNHNPKGYKLVKGVHLKTKPFKAVAEYVVR